MGIEPGPALRALELDILALDDVEVASSGDPLDSTTEATEAAAPSVDAGPIERRTVTSIAIVRRPDQDAPVDPEDLEQLLEESRVRWREILGRYDAVVETIPDGLLGHVGYPTARERDAERAIRAAFEVVEGGSCAAGVATGTVLVTPGSDGATFTGESPSTAVRLAMNGPTSSVSAAPHTQRLTDDRVTYETVDDSVVVADLEPATTMATHGTLVGRDEELALAHRVADEARTGRGRVLVVTGQAGIGKTAFVERVAHEVGVPVLRFVGSPFHADTALWPVATALSDHPDLDLPDVLEVWANEGVDALVEAAPDPADRRSILLDTAVDAIFDRAEREPLMCVFEDVHSMDASTLELVSELSQAAPSVSLLVVVAIRGNDSMGFADAEHATTIGLGPLGEGSAHEMIAGVADGGLSDEIVSAIVARGGGVPLFIEELTRSIGSASGDQSSAVAVIPESVQDLLMARLDAVPSARTTLHVAAAAGNAFTEALVTAVAEDRSGLRSELDDLCEAGVLVRERHRRGVRYRFRHALIRDTAYESIPKSRRVELHANIARAMADSESSDVAVEALARHLEAAGEYQDALAAWLRAANASLAVSALSEAGESVRRGLAIADSLDPDGRTAVVEEIADLWLARGVIETQEHGPASDAAVSVYEHLLTESGAGLTDAQRFRALWGRWFGLSTRWNTTEALVAAEEVHRAAEASGDAALQIEGHHVMWATLLTVGEFARSLEHTRSARALYNRADHHWLTYEFGGHDPEVCMHSISGVSLWLLGRHDEARTAVAAAPALGDQLDHAYSRLEASFGPVTIAVLGARATPMPCGAKPMRSNNSPRVDRFRPGLRVTSTDAVGLRWLRTEISRQAFPCSSRRLRRGQTCGVRIACRSMDALRSPLPTPTVLTTRSAVSIASSSAPIAVAGGTASCGEHAVVSWREPDEPRRPLSITRQPAIWPHRSRRPRWSKGRSRTSTD